jgi:drug/metabolite transporter (DMT)-like permease
MQVPATTAGFLVQSTTVITPLLAFIAGETISRFTWTACGVSIFGTMLVTADGLSETSIGGALAGGTVVGKLTVLSAALFYSLSTYRLSQLSPGKLHATMCACVCVLEVILVLSLRDEQQKL